MALLRLYNKNLLWGGSNISEEISKMVGAFGISVNKLGGDICRSIWETMHLTNNHLVLKPEDVELSRFKKFCEGGWLLLESLLVESQMGVRVTVFCCPENHNLFTVQGAWDRTHRGEMLKLMRWGVSLSLKCFILHDPQSYYLAQWILGFGT
ncbi:hypothetical protein Bca4012_066790 [Brassica carinata]